MNPVATPLAENNEYKRRAQDRKCRLTLAHMLSHLAKMLANPVNETMIQDAAREAGQTEFSAESRERLLRLIDQLAGKLSREEK